MSGRFLARRPARGQSPGGLGRVRRGIPCQKIRPDNHQLTLAEILAIEHRLGNVLTIPCADIAKGAQLLANRREGGRHFKGVEARHAKDARFNAGDGLRREQRFQPGVIAAFVGTADDIRDSLRLGIVAGTFGNAHNDNDRFRLVGDCLEGCGRGAFVPAFAMALCTLVISTGLLSGKVAASASLAVQTMPIIAVDTVEMTRVPSLISTTWTP